MKEEQVYLFENSNSTYKRNALTIPIDTLILFIVIILLLFILSYSLGIEKGKKIAHLNLDTNTFLVERPQDSANILDEIDLSTKNALTEPKNEQNITQITTTTSSLIIKNEPEPEPKQIQQETKKVASTKLKEEMSTKYAIQVASYVNQTHALQEANKLQRQGYPVFIEKKGKFVALYVGKFDTKPEAVRIQQNLKTKYSDCILRELQTNSKNKEG